MAVAGVGSPPAHLDAVCAHIVKFAAINQAAVGAGAQGHGSLAHLAEGTALHSCTHSILHQNGSRRRKHRVLPQIAPETALDTAALNVLRHGPGGMAEADAAEIQALHRLIPGALHFHQCLQGGNDHLQGIGVHPILGVVIEFSGCRVVVPFAGGIHKDQRIFKIEPVAAGPAAISRLDLEAAGLDTDIQVGPDRVCCRVETGHCLSVIVPGSTGIHLHTLEAFPSLRDIAVGPDPGIILGIHRLHSPRLAVRLPGSGGSSAVNKQLPHLHRIKRRRQRRFPQAARCCGPRSFDGFPAAEDRRLTRVGRKGHTAAVHASL